MLSRFVRIGTTLVVLGVLAVSAVAQDQPPGGRGGRGGGAGQSPGGPGGGFGRGGMGMGMGMGMGGGAAQLLGLLRAPEVRKEVGLSDETYAAVEKAQEEWRQAGRGQGGGNRFQDLQNASEEERTKIMAEMRAEMEKRNKEQNEKAQALLDEVLTPDGMNRLLGLYAQLNSFRSVSNELVAKKINLSEDSKKKIEAAQTKLGEEMRAQFTGGRGGPGGGAPGGGGGGFDPEAMRARFEEMQKKGEEAISSNMTDAEKKALEDLKGAKFTFPEGMNRGFGGFGGPGGGGPGGPGGGRGGRGGGRPNSDSGT